MITVFRADPKERDAIAKAVLEIENFFLREEKGNLYGLLLDMIEKPLIENLLDKTGGNQLKAAKILGINRNTLRSKAKKLGIDARWYKKGRGYGK